MAAGSVGVAPVVRPVAPWKRRVVGLIFVSGYWVFLALSALPAHGLLGRESLAYYFAGLTGVVLSAGAAHHDLRHYRQRINLQTNGVLAFGAAVIATAVPALVLSVHYASRGLVFGGMEALGFSALVNLFQAPPR